MSLSFAAEELSESGSSMMGSDSDSNVSSGFSLDSGSEDNSVSCSSDS